MTANAGVARGEAPGRAGGAEAILASLAGDGRTGTMDEAIDALLDGPPRPRADLAGAAVALGRAIDAVGGPDALPRGGPAILLVAVPSADWVAPVATVAGIHLAAAGIHGRLGPRRSVDPLILEADGTSKAHGPDGRNDDVAETLHLGGVVVGVSQDTSGLLPRDLVRGADLRIDVSGLDPDGVALVIGAVTGEPVEARLGADLADLCDPTDLTLSVHAARGADASHGRLADILAAKVGRHSDEPGLERLAGYGAARDWGLALVADLRAWRANDPDAPRWRDIESAILLSGPPGVGKTSFAAALARSAGVPLFAGSLAQWQSARDGHLGHTLGAMRLFFERARRSPCVVLIDEIDAFGDRSRYPEEHRSYSVQVCDGLLEQLDGTAGREGVVVVGATNHPELLDPAIVRSGRLDRHVRIDSPGPDDLVAILSLHLDGAIPRSELPALAPRMSGMTGADVAGLVRRARGAARRAGRAMVLEDLEAVLEPAAPSLPPAARRRISVHEAGHALVAWALGIGEPRGISVDADGGCAWIEPREALGLATEDDLDCRLATALAGRAAESVIFGAVTAGGHQDLEVATHLALAMETRLGFSRETPLLAVGILDPGELPRHPRIATAVHDRLVHAYGRAVGVLRRRRVALDRLSAALERDGRLDAAGIRRTLGRRRTGRRPSARHA